MQNQDYLGGEDLGAGGAPSPYATNGTQLRGATEKGGGSNSCTCLRGNIFLCSTDGNETSQREKENKANHSPQRNGPERRYNDDGNGYDDEDDEETRKKSLTGLTTIKTPTSNRKKSLFSKRTGQTNGSGDTPTTKRRLSQKRKESSVGNEEESMTSRNRMKMKAPPSKSGGLIGMPSEKKMEVIELDDSDDSDDSDDEAVKDPSPGRSSLKRDVSEAFDFTNDTSDDDSSMSSSKKRRRTREGNRPSGGKASSAAVASKPSASGASNFVVMLDSSDSEDSSASRKKTTMKKRRRRSTQSSLTASNTASSGAAANTASSGAAAKSRSKQSSSLKKSIGSFEFTSASKPSPDFDFTNDSSDDESPQPSRESQPSRVSKAAASTASSASIFKVSNLPKSTGRDEGLEKFLAASEPSPEASKHSSNDDNSMSASKKKKRKKKRNGNQPSNEDYGFSSNSIGFGKTPKRKTPKGASRTQVNNLVDYQLKQDAKKAKVDNDCDLTNDSSSDDESTQPSRDSSKTLRLKVAVSRQKMLSKLSKQDRDTLSRLQDISDYCLLLINHQSFNPKDAKPQTYEYGNESVTVPIYARDRPELIKFIEKSHSFAVYVAKLRTDVDYHEHVKNAEIEIYFELAQGLAPLRLKQQFRINVVLKCPKHKERANGENIETGESNDHSKACASVDAMNVLESSFPFTFIKRASGTTGRYINARQSCIKDPNPKSCGCLDWRTREKNWCHRTLTATGIYHQAIGVPSLLICFGGGSALKVVQELKDKHLFTFNDEFGPHICTCVCHYGYDSIEEQLMKMHKKVQSISLTLDRFVRNVARKNPTLRYPEQTMLEIFCESKKTPMVNKPTDENIETASAAETKRRSTLAKNNWANPEIRKRMVENRWTEERKDEQSEKMIKKWANPEGRKKMEESWTEDRRDDLSELTKKKWKDPESGLNVAATKARNANPMLSEKHFITVPATKTKLWNNGQNLEVFACKYCVCAFGEGKIEPYVSNGILKEPINKVYAMKNWKSNCAKQHLERCTFCPDSVKGRDFSV